MSGTIHVFDFLDELQPKFSNSVVPLFGGERFLQQLAIKKIKSMAGGEFAVNLLDGQQTDWSDVQDQLSTRSLFSSSDEQIIVLDHADPFVKSHRDRIENRFQLKHSGVLVLVVETWASNTKLYKAIDKSGLQIFCAAPIIKRGRSKQRDDSKICKWLISRAKSVYEFELSHSSASVLLEMCECNFGRMDQELGKLCLYVKPGSELSPLEVKKIVGGWPAQTMWTAIDAALDGKAGQGIELLHQLFAAGEHPLAMFGQISWSLRRFAEAGELVERDHRNRRRLNLNDTLKQAGFRPWGGELDSAGKRLKRLGRSRVRNLLNEIVEVDFALKRTHSKEDRGRLLLEKLFVSMSDQLKR